DDDLPKRLGDYRCVHQHVHGGELRADILNEACKTKAAVKLELPPELDQLIEVALLVRAEERRSYDNCLLLAVWKGARKCVDEQMPPLPRRDPSYDPHRERTLLRFGGRGDRRCPRDNVRGAAKRFGNGT